MIDLNGAATGACDATSGAICTLQGDAALAGAAAVRDSARGGVVIPHGFATLELDGDPPPTLTTPTVTVIVMLGDSTGDRSVSGDNTDEWIYRVVQAWVERYDYSFTYAWSFNADDPFSTGYQSVGPLNIGTSDRLIVVWNPSKGGLSFSRLLQEPTMFADYTIDRNPDIVVMAMGHNQSAESLQADIESVVAGIDAAVAGVQYVVSSQNPRADDAGSPEKRDNLAATAADNGFLFVDAYRAFINYGDWESLLSDDVHPTPEGSQLWADTFNTATFLTAAGELVGTGDTVATCSTSTPAVACSTPTPALACTISA